MGIPRLKVLGYLFLITFARIGVGLSKIIFTNPDTPTPGGAKLLVDGDVLSFNTIVCSGGVFFKQPVQVQMICVHGYYLARPNGCSMESSKIIGGGNFVCQRNDDDKPELIQAFIPVTDPDHPLDHTITLYDDLKTLKNFRRYTFDKIKKEKYEQIITEPVGAIVANAEEIRTVNIDGLCYEGKAQKAASSYMASLHRNTNNTVESRTKLISVGCNIDSIEFPWGNETTFNFLQGSSYPEIFSSEVKAELPKQSDISDFASESDRFEIWEGLAYCLQANSEISNDGKLKVGGFEPSIESLELFCPTSAPVVTDSNGKRGKRWYPLSHLPDLLLGNPHPWPGVGHGGNPYGMRRIGQPWVPPWRPPPFERMHRHFIPRGWRG